MMKILLLVLEVMKALIWVYSKAMGFIAVNSGTVHVRCFEEENTATDGSSIN